MKLLPPASDARITLDETSPLADPGRRLAARTIDALLPLALAVPLYFIGVISHSALVVRASFGLLLAASVLTFIVDLVWLHRYGQSIGKRLLGIRIVRSDGERASLGRIFSLRMFAPGALSLIPFLGALFSLANPLFIFFEPRRCIHDLIADTIVVDTRFGEPAADSASTPKTF